MAGSDEVGRPWLVYVIECDDGRLYTGVTNDLVARFATRVSGEGAAFTRMNKPLRLLASRTYPSRSVALKAEALLRSRRGSSRSRGSRRIRRRTRSLDSATGGPTLEEAAQRLRRVVRHHVDRGDAGSFELVGQLALGHFRSVRIALRSPDRKRHFHACSNSATAANRSAAVFAGLLFQRTTRSQWPVRPPRRSRTSA